MPKGQKPYASPSKKLEANADLANRRAAVDRMPEGLAKQKAQTKLNVDENTRDRLFKADGGRIARGPMARMPVSKPTAPKSRVAMMSNGGKAKKGC